MVNDVIVEQESCHGPKLLAAFEYHNVQPSGKLKPQERVVTPSTIRKLVLHALSNGWESESKGKPDLYINGEFVAPL